MAVLSDEQTMLKDAAREWTAAKSPTSAFRRLRDAAPETGFDKALWRDMAEMGWAGVLIPEIYGGSEFGHRALGVILEETGRTLTASPLLSTALIVPTVLIQGGSAARNGRRGFPAWLTDRRSGLWRSRSGPTTAPRPPRRRRFAAAKAGD